MAKLPGIPAAIRWREQGSVAAFVEITPGNFDFPDSNINPDTISVAEGIDARTRSRSEFSIPVYTWAEFAALNTLMLTDKRLEVEFEFASGSPTVFNYDPISFNVVPLIGSVPNLCRCWIGAVNAVGNPSTDPGNWTDLGEFFGTSQPTFTPNVEDDGKGVPLYLNQLFQHDFRLQNNAATDLGTRLSGFPSGDKVDMQIEMPTGQFLEYKNVTIYYDLIPRFAVNELVTYDFQVARLVQDPLDAITPPATTPKFEYGFRLSMAAASTNLSDYLTVTL